MRRKFRDIRVGAVDGRSDWVTRHWKWESDEGLTDEAQPII